MNVNEVSSSITHLEDLPLSEFIHVIRKLHEYEITEKVDGAQILFGLDEKGFYTSRETKGGTRIYEADRYDIKFSTTYMRSAHRLLEKVLPTLLAAGMAPGDQVEAEVLFGELPNVVPYSADTNYLIFLRTTAGNANIDRLQQKLSGLSLPICLESPYTEDGKSIILVEETNNWEFARVPKLPVDTNMIQKKVVIPLRQMQVFLESASGINNLSNKDIESIPLNKRPTWCAVPEWKIYKDLIKEKKTEINNIIHNGFILEIKEILLDHIVRNRGSYFGPEVNAGGWIEGVVLKHRDSGKVVKLVDKSTFGIIREFAWEVRNNLIENAKSVENNPSFVGKLRVAMATALGHPDLGTLQAKNYLRKIGTLTEERIYNLSKSVNFSNVKDYWISLLETKEKELLENFYKYEKEKTKRKVVVFEGQIRSPLVCRYDGTPIDQRTREVFASIFEQISSYKSTINNSKSVNDLIFILVGKQLTELT
jgi:hypothetical protein